MRGACSILALIPLFGCAMITAPAPVERLDRRHLVPTFSQTCEKTFKANATGAGPAWKTQYWFGSQSGVDSRTLNGEQQIYSDSDFNGYQPLKVENGRCVLTLGPGDWGVPKSPDKLYVSGLLTTETLFSQTYGYFEIRATLPVGKGLWPAFWLLPVPVHRDGWAKDGGPEEIDVFEDLGNREKLYQSLHARTESGGEVRETAVAPVDRPHTYGVLWTKDWIIWYIDDVETNRQRNADFHRPAYMLIDFASGGWAGPVGPMTPIPAHLVIESIRAYRLAP